MGVGMALQLHNLDARTRGFMLEELELDVASGNLYISPRLSSRGQADYQRLLREAASERDEVWLGEALRSHGRMSSTEFQRNPRGGRSMVRVPASAAGTLAEEEFARYCARGICRRAMEEGIPRVIIYQAKSAANPRQEFQAMIGSEIDAQGLLAELRGRGEGEQALRLPPGPNSELNVRLP